MTDSPAVGGVALVLVGLNLIWQVAKGNLLTRIGFLKPSTPAPAPAASGPPQPPGRGVKPGPGHPDPHGFVQ